MSTIYLLNVSRTWLFLVIILLSMASSSLSGSDGKKALSLQGGIFSGRRELSFDEAYRVKISLPIPESDFLNLLHRLKLDFDVLAERRGDKKIPPPLYHPEVLNLSDMVKCYNVYGRKKGERYRAYVDTKHRVVYIENDFSYANPL